VLVDEEFGSSVAYKAKQVGYLLAMPVERPGRRSQAEPTSGEDARDAVGLAPCARAEIPVRTPRPPPPRSSSRAWARPSTRTAYESPVAVRARTGAGPGRRRPRTSSPLLTRESAHRTMLD
jgi:hypothetical protein